MTRAAWVALAPALAVACASVPRSPAEARAYEVVVADRDTFARALSAELERAGLRVRRTPRGGAPAPAVLVWYEFREPGPDGRRWLLARLFHARSAALLAATQLPVESLPPAGRERAKRLVTALLTPADTAVTVEEPVN
jgi:hypothetical protein